MTETLARLKEQYADPEALRQFLPGLLAEAGLSQERAGKEAGISGSALNQWMQAKYKGDNAAIAEKLLIWLASRERKSTARTTVAGHGYTETDTSGKIIAALTFAQSVGDFVVLYGGAGIGKTFTIKHYSTLNPNVWVVTMRPDTSKVAGALEEIGEVMGIRNGRSNRLSRDICKRVDESAGLLVIDEAQHLTVEAIEAIRSIHDATEIGVVLSGNESIYVRLTGGARAANCAQLFSRVGKRLRLTKPTKQDVTALAARYGITEEKELSILIGISQKPGALRGMVKTLRLAVMFAGGSVPTNEHIAAAWRDLGGEA